MNDKNLFYQIHRCFFVIVGTISTAMFYGLVVAIVGKYIFTLEDMKAYIFLGVPVGGIVAWYLYPKMARILGYE